MVVVQADDDECRNENIEIVQKAGICKCKLVLVAACWAATSAATDAKTAGEICLDRQKTLDPATFSSVAGTANSTQDDSSLAICRDIGLRIPKLQQAWDSYRTPWEAQFVSEPSEALNRRFEALAVEVYDQITRDLSGGFPLPIQFVFVDLNAPPMDQLIADAHDLCFAHLGDSGIGGFSSETTSVICASEQSLTLDAWAKIKQTLLHEAYHNAQFQLLSAPLPSQTREDRLRDWGPEWVIEGSAQYYALQYPALCPSDGIAYLREQTGTSPISLEELELFWEDSEELESAKIKGRASRYHLALLAACELVNSSGPGSFHKYFQAIGLGQSWEAAFSHTFGNDIASFYATFEFERHVALHRDINDTAD